ncbi:MAG: GNAT family N-acetyltransferase [Bacteroidetes bacterium 4572_77]|nr:MAG: GNAT family N-acetyltransferase [Bacteroidetes bacterium 4572_77]
MEIKIRTIEERDNLLLGEIIQEVFEEHKAPKTGTMYDDPALFALSDSFKSENCVLFVAELNQQIVGCCGIFPTAGLPDNYAELVKFYLLKKARGIGIGKVLMEKSIAFAKDYGYKNIYLESFPSFNNAVNIYLKQGFKHISKPLGNSGHTSCNIWLVKEI